MPPLPKAGKSRKHTKVQTRIAFAPANSSPAPENSSPSPARVVYESSKRSSAMATSSRSTSSRADSAPRTSQAQLSFSTVSHNEDDSGIDEDGIPEGKKFAVVIRSSSANISSPAKSMSSNTSSKPRKAASFMPAASKPKSRSKLQNIILVDSSEGEPVESEDEADKPLKKIPKLAARSKPVEDEDDDEEEEEEDEEEDEEEEDEEGPVQMTPRIAGRRKPSYLNDSDDEEPFTKPPKAVVRDGRVVIPGEATPSPSPPPGGIQPRKAVNSRSFIAGGQLGQVRHKDDHRPIVVGRKHVSPDKNREEKRGSLGKKTKSKDKNTIVLLSDDESSANGVAKAPASSRKKVTPHRHAEAHEDSYDSEPAGYMLEHQAEKAGRKDKAFGTRVTKDEHPTGTPHGGADDNYEDASVVRSPIKRLRKSSKKDRQPEPPSQSESEEEVSIMPTPARRRRLSPPPITEDEDEDDEIPIAPTPARRGYKRARSSSADSDLPLVRTPGNKRRKPSNLNSDNDQHMVDLGSDIDNDTLFDSPIKVAPVAPMRVRAAERARVDEKSKDKEEAKSKTVGETVAQRVRSSQPKRHRTQKEKAMELMRRKRNGEKITQLTESESSEDEHRQKMGMYDTDSELEVLDHFDDEEEENTEAIRKSLLPHNRNKNKDDDDEDDFVVDDDDEPLGVPGGLHDIPIEFTNQAHKKLSEHFKDAVEWMVQRRINPGFQKDDPVYITAFRKLEDDPTGLVNSKLVSTVWNAKFVSALKARPEYNEMEIGASGEGRKCDACNRGKHPVSFAVTLKGKPYDKTTLEEIDQSDDENSDSDDSSSSKTSTLSRTVDAKGARLASAKKQWYLGSTCKANASAAHGLIHWKHFLDEWVFDALQLEGWFKPENLAERSLWKKKQLSQLSMDIVDEWTETKQLKPLYNEFKQRIETARSLTHDRYGKR